jgi:hypothetical protein
MANLVDPRSNRRFDLIAAFHIEKPPPVAPGLHHVENLDLPSETRSVNATTTLWFRAVNARC